MERGELRDCDLVCVETDDGLRKLVVEKSKVVEDEVVSSEETAGG